MNNSSSRAVDQRGSSWRRESSDNMQLRWLAEGRVPRGCPASCWDLKSHHYPSVYLGIFYLQSHRLRWQWDGRRDTWSLQRCPDAPMETRSRTLRSLHHFVAGVVCKLYRNQWIFLLNSSFFLYLILKLIIGVSGTSFLQFQWRALCESYV